MKMERALEACRALLARFDAGDGHVSLRDAGVILLALERNLIETELRSIMVKLGRRTDGAMNLIGLCEMMSYAMKGVPHTRDTLSLVDPNGLETVVTLADVAAADMKALYMMHPTFDEQGCWLHTESALAASCMAKGDAVHFAVTNQPTSYFIHACDWVQRPCRNGGARFEVRIRGPASLKAEVVDKTDGTYIASYTCSVSGSYSMDVTLYGAHISGSPFTLVVDADQTRPEYCVAEGAGLTCAEAGDAATFVIHKRDRRGNPRTRGVDHFYADVQGPVSHPSRMRVHAHLNLRSCSLVLVHSVLCSAPSHPVFVILVLQGKWACTIKDRRDGSYSVAYTAKTAGIYRLDVGLAPNLGPIAHSPFSIVVLPSTPDPRMTKLDEPLPESIVCGRPFTMQLTVRDRWGNVCNQHLMAQVEQASAWLVADGERTREPAQVLMSEPGRYALTLTPTTRGKHTVHICWAGMHVKGSPFTLKALPAPPHASSYKLIPTPVSWPVLHVGTQFNLRIQAYDRYGNMCTAGCPVPRLWLQGTRAMKESSAHSDEARSRSSCSIQQQVSETVTSPARMHVGVPYLHPTSTPCTDPQQELRCLPYVDGHVEGGDERDALSDAAVGDGPVKMISTLSQGQVQVQARVVGPNFSTRPRSALGIEQLGLPGSWQRPAMEAYDSADSSVSINAAVSSPFAKRTELAAATPSDPVTSMTHATDSDDAGLAHAFGRPACTQPVAVESECKVVDLSHGVYQVSGTCLRAGSYELRIRLPTLLSSAADEAKHAVANGSLMSAMRYQQSLAANISGLVETAEAGYVASEEDGVLCAEVKVLAGATWPPACMLSGKGITVAYVGEACYLELVAVDKHGNVKVCGGDIFELRAHRVVPAGQRKQYDMDYDVLDSNDGRYKITYYLKTPGRWELSLLLVCSSVDSQDQFICRTPCQCGQAGAAAAGGSYVSTPESEIHSLVGGSSFLVVVRPKITRDMSASEAVAAMEAHARIETALACEAFAVHSRRASHLDSDEPAFESSVDSLSVSHNSGDGLNWATAGDVVAFIVRLPPQPRSSPPRKIAHGNGNWRNEIVSENADHANASWSVVEHLVLEQAKLSVQGLITPSSGSAQRRTSLADFVLNGCRDNGDGCFHVAFTANVAGRLSLSVELVGGGHIRGSPFAVEVLPNAVDVAMSTVSGSGLVKSEVGVRSHFDVYPRDRCGNARPFERSEVNVHIARALAGAEACRVDLTDGPNGGCRVSYTLLEPGEYLVHVSIGSECSDECGGSLKQFEPIRGSPFTLICDAGPVELSCCTLLEAGIGSEPLKRIASVGGGRLWIQTRDRLANARSTTLSHELWCEIRAQVRSDDQSVAVTSIGTVVKCSCIDLGDGRVEVVYPSNTPLGLNEVWIGLSDTHAAREDHLGSSNAFLSGDGVTAQVQQRLGHLLIEPAICFAISSLITPPGVLRITPGMLIDVIVRSADDAGRQQARGGERLRAQLKTGPAPVSLDVHDNGNGSYRVATAVHVCGEYKIVFHVNGLPIAGSPIMLVAQRTLPARAGVAGGGVLPTSSSALSPRKAYANPQSMSSLLRQASSPRSSSVQDQRDRTDNSRGLTIPFTNSNGKMPARAERAPPRRQAAFLYPASTDTS